MRKESLNDGHGEWVDDASPTSGGQWPQVAIFLHIGHGKEERWEGEEKDLGPHNWNGGANLYVARSSDLPGLNKIMLHIVYYLLKKVENMTQLQITWSTLLFKFAAYILFDLVGGKSCLYHGC